LGFLYNRNIGDFSKNPLEGTYNDVQIISISRAIEIDIREMIEDPDIPETIKESNGFLL
jgi:putative membrane protein